MPKRVGHIYERMLDKDFIRIVVYRACKHRRERFDVSKVLDRIDGVVDDLYYLLSTGKYVPAKYQEKQRFDQSSQKFRTIRTVPFFPDCLIQWLIVEVAKEDIFLRSMDYWCSASVPGRGGGRVYKGIRHYISHHPKQARYCLLADTRHFYDTINIDILMQRLRRRCKDERFLRLIESIVRASSEDGNIGIGIGYNLNQWLANFFLEDVDRAIRKIPGIGLYVRYMDNMTFLGPNKRKLQKLKRAIDAELAKQGLSVKGDWQVFPIASRPVQAVGFRYMKDGRTMIRKRNWLRLRRQALRVIEKQKEGIYIPPEQARSLLSRKGTWSNFGKSRKSSRIFSGLDISDIKRRAV